MIALESGSCRSVLPLSVTASTTLAGLTVVSFTWAIEIVFVAFRVVGGGVTTSTEPITRNRAGVDQGVGDHIHGHGDNVAGHGRGIAPLPELVLTAA